MANTIGTEGAGPRRNLHPAATDTPVTVREGILPLGTTTYEPAREEGVSRALELTGRATRLLGWAFVSMIEQEELSMPALERLYAALQETEAAAVAIEETRSKKPRHGVREPYTTRNRG